MDAIADVLQPYKDLVGAIAGIVTAAQMFSGSFICYDIYKAGSSKGIGIGPFLGGLVMGVLNLKFGFILRDDTMIRVNFLGIALSLVYVMIYYSYAPSKGAIWGQLGIVGAFCAALIAYAEIEDPKLVEARFGTIITALMFYLISMPLFGLKQIIKNKSTQGMPFPIIFSGTIVTFMWLLYGIILRNPFIVLQNVVAFGLCGAQLSLFVIYPSKPQEKQKVKPKKAD